MTITRHHTNLLRIFAALAAIVALLPAARVSAVEYPTAGSPVYFQTSGPSAGLGIGDWYTSPAGGSTDHMLQLHVPAAWPSTTPVTVAVYDPESRAGSTGLAAIDEVRGTADVTRFRVVDPGSGTLVAHTFSSSAAYHGQWIELITFVPSAGTTYLLSTETGVGATSDGQRDDDNAWRVSFTSDPDCAIGEPVGTCSGIESGNESNDADGVPGTGDELAVSVVRTTYQSGGTSSVTFWFHVDASSASTVTLHNFDLDNSGSVTYTRASGTTVVGSVSGQTRWNNSVNATRSGDVVPTDGSSGWWRAAISASANNQFIFEVDGQAPVFLVQPPTPVLSIAIDDGDLDIAEGEAHSYFIDVANTSDATAVPGAAIETDVTVPLPSGVVYASCAAPAGVTCSESGGIVTFTFADPFIAGADAQLSIDVTGGPGMPSPVSMTATARFEDQLGNRGQPVTATDTNTTQYPNLAVTVAPDVTAAPSDVVVMTVDIANTGDHLQPGTVVTVPLPPGVTVDGSGTDPQWSCIDGDAEPALCTWTLGDMAPASAASAPLAFAVAPTIPAGFETLDVVASGSGEYAESDDADNASTATVTIDAVPDLAIEVVTPPTYVPGAPTDWGVQVENLGNQDAAGVVATVVVPIDATASATAGWTCVPDATSGSSCTYSVGNLPAGDSISLPFPIDTDPAAIDAATLDAGVTDDGSGGPDPVPANNSDSATVSPSPIADLSMDVSVGVEPVNLGDPTGFTLTVGNSGPSVAASTTVTISVPEGLTGATPPLGCTPVGTWSWSCPIGDLYPGDTMIVTVTGTADAASLTLAGTAGSPTDPAGASGSATATANRPPVADDTTAETEDRTTVSIAVPASDPDGDDLSVTVTAPDGSAIVVAGPGGPEILYTPGPVTAGTVVLTYQACDPNGLCDEGVVEVLVKRAFLDASTVCIADVPYLSYEVTTVGLSGDHAATISWTDGSNTLTMADMPLSGLALWPGASADDITKNPVDRMATDWPGWILVNGMWTAGDDGFAWSAGPDVTVSVRVNPTSEPLAVTYPASTSDCSARPDGPSNRPPIGTDIAGWASSAFPFTADLLVGTSDPDGDPITITSVTPSGGRATIVDGILTYTPGSGDAGTIVLDVEITDGRGAFATFSVTIDVAPARAVSGVAFVDADGDGMLDEGEKPIIDGTVTMTHPGADGVLGTEDDLVMTARTGLDGRWTIDSVPVDVANVTVTATGYVAVTVTTDADFVVTAFAETLPVTGADLARVGITGLILLVAGLLAIGWRPRTEK